MVWGRGTRKARVHLWYGSGYNRIPGVAGPGYTLDPVMPGFALVRGVPGNSVYPDPAYFRLLDSASEPEFADFWGLDGPLLPQNPLDQVGVKPPTCSSGFCGRRGPFAPPKISEAP